MSIRTREIIGKAILETLEGRQMLSTVTLSDGVLLVQGNNSAANQISIHAAHHKVWAVTDQGSSEKIASSRIRQIRIIGGEKNDTVSVDAGVKIPVYVQTGNGNDRIRTARGRDTIVSGNGRDSVSSGAGRDQIDAGNGSDKISAGGGNDYVADGNGNDSIDDGKGNDFIGAGSGDDSVHSGAGRDIL